MKITEITIDIVERNLDFVGSKVFQASGVTGGIVHQGILRIKTENGIEGNCIIGQHRGDSLQKINNIRKFTYFLKNKSVFSTNNLWNFINSMPRFSMNRFSDDDFSAYSSIDVALWDAKGKLLNLPVYSLLGGENKEIKAYGTYQPRHNEPEGYINESEEIKNLNLKAYKIHPGPMETKKTIKMINDVRKNLGGNFTLMIDPNNSYDLKKSLDIGEALDENDFYWFEDPLKWDDFKNIEILGSKLKTPLAMTDQSEFNFKEIYLYSSKLYPQILRGTSRKLGITGLMKACAVAESSKKLCEIGTGGNIFFNMANIHVTSSINNCNFYEYWMPTLTSDFATIEKIQLDSHGNVFAFNKPGLGISLDENWIKDNIVDKIKLI
tara:strand:- start:1000 stop:2139 length:1140 start_codon:yes stop_codon:yes gene_type:complete